MPWVWEDFSSGSVALLTDGSFAITTDRGDSLAHEVQFFDPAGALLSTRLLDDNLLGYATVGSLGTTYLTVAQEYHVEGSRGWVSNRHAYAQLYDNAGTALGTQFLWPGSALRDFGYAYRFGSGPRWDFLPITHTVAPDLVDGYPQYLSSLRIAVPNRVVSEPPIAIGPPVAVQIEDAAINGNGRFVVVSYDPASRLRGLQIFGRGGKPITRLLTANIAQTLSSVFVAINPHGQVLMSFVDPSGEFAVRLYDERGSPISAPIELSSAGAPGVPRAAVDMKGLSDGSFIVSWQAQLPGRRGEVFVIARLDARTGRFDAPVLLANAPDAFLRAILRMNVDGTGILVWMSRSGPLGPYSQGARQIVVRP